MGTPKKVCVCYSLRALDIADYKERCIEYLTRRAPRIKWALLSLEALAKECMAIVNKNGLEYDSYPLLLFLKELPLAIPFEIQTVSLMTKLKYLYYQRKLQSYLRGSFFNEYIEVVKENLQDCHCASEFVAVVRKFLRVCHVINFQQGLSAQDISQYEFVAELLNLCYHLDVQDNELVIDLLKMTINMYLVELFDTRLMKQPQYPGGFFKYILERSRKAKFDIAHYCKSHPQTMWQYSNNFSVVNAVSFGNINRTLSLLQYGIEVFPESEVRKCGHGFPFIDEVLPPSYLMILQMMSSIRSTNHFLSRAIHDQERVIRALNPYQKECFRIVWRSIPFPYVKQAQLGLAISSEYFFLARHAIFDSTRYQKHTESSVLYEISFHDMASGATGPRSLKHLARCCIRESLRKTWNLPDGVFQVGLPVALERYLNNMEED